MATSTPETSDSREELRPYLNRRIEVEGTVSKVGTFWDSQARCNVPSICLTNPEIREDDHLVVGNHVWVAYARLAVDAGVDKGDTVRCSVQVYSYRQRDPADPSKTYTRYGFREPRELKCLSRQLQPAKEEPVVSPIPIPPAPHTANGAAVIAEPAPVAAAAPAPAPAPDARRELFDALWSLAAQHGRDKVEKTLQAVFALMDA